MRSAPSRSISTRSSPTATPPRAASAPPPRGSARRADRRAGPGRPGRCAPPPAGALLRGVGQLGEAVGQLEPVRVQLEALGHGRVLALSRASEAIEAG